jgi:hypothetical protein
MTNERLNTRYTAALACYRQAQAARPGSESSEAAEHAVLLTLSTARPEKPSGLTSFDALRDARHSVRRSRARRARALEAAAHLAGQGIRLAAAGPPADLVTPEQRAITRELLDCLIARARELGPPAPRVLAGLLVGESENDTASALAVSRATVSRTRRALRAVCLHDGLLAA